MHRKRESHRIFYILIGTFWALNCMLIGAVLGLLPQKTREPASAPGTKLRLVPIALPLSVNACAYPETLALRADAPTILIYHTHTTEAYFPTPEHAYTQSGAWRTKDSAHNVTAVGSALADALTRYGFSVLHDTTNHEPPKLSSAYSRSEETMRRALADFPGILLMIDVHRDAFGGEPTEPCDAVTLYGTECARIMCVVGKGEDYADKPYFDSNYALAARVTAHLIDLHPDLARPVRVKKGRYNQHVLPHCLLIEVGHNGNTLEQALASVPYLADAIAYAAAKTRPRVSSWLPKPDRN